MPTEFCPEGMWGQMPLTQLVNFELGTDCNLGPKHKACPNRHPDRYGNLDTSRILRDKDILRVARRLHHEFGFYGLVGWHYYNEPLLYEKRMFSLMEKLSKLIPGIRFILWTNGHNIPQDLESCKKYGTFEKIFVTKHTKESRSGAGRLESVLSENTPATDINLVRGDLDSRIRMYGPNPISSQSCTRVFTEFSVDYHGNVHLCCYDWKGLMSPGNILKDNLDKVIANAERIRSRVIQNPMDPDAPDVCLRCRMKNTTITGFVPETVDQIENYRLKHIVTTRETSREKVLQKREPAVVFVHYRLPKQRLKEHFQWNKAIYTRYRTKVFVVSDKPYTVPDYAECVVFPPRKLPTLAGEPRFSIAATKNFGIRHAIMEGYQKVICTDVDIAFDPLSFHSMTRVNANYAFAPICWMVDSYEKRENSGRHDTPMINTIAMDSTCWLQCPYDERCIGYGSDDGIIIQDIRLAGINLDRSGVVYHIAHEPGTNQVNFAGRSDFWNRDNGFNFNNLQANKQLYEERRARQA